MAARVGTLKHDTSQKDLTYVAGGGVHQVKWYMETKKDKDNANGMYKQLTIQHALFRSKNLLEDDSTEVLCNIHFPSLLSN